MTLGRLRQIAAFAILAMLAWIAVEPALAQAPTPPTPNKGDTAWMMTSSALVLLMTIPGLALFYGGLVRTKNMLSMLMQVFYTVCVVCIIWVLYGYSMAFTEGTTYNMFFGGFSKVFLAGVTPESNVETFTHGVVIPELTFVCFQMTFAAITPALIVGGMAERMKFSAVALFIPLWVTFVYFPIAHMVWYWAGPDAIVTAAKAVADAGADAAKKQAAMTVIAELDRLIPGFAAQVEVVDVATPLTVERFTGNYHGLQAYAPKNFLGTMMHGLSKTLPGLQDFYMVGQWAGATIGVSTVAVMGRALVTTLCKKDGKRFVTTQMKQH